MRGGRITSEEKTTISMYVGLGIAVVLIAGGLYFFFLAQKEKKETTTFDPNRPVPSDAVLKQRLKAEEYFVVRQGGTQTPFQNDFWNNDRTGIYVDVITNEPLFTSLDTFSKRFLEQRPDWHLRRCHYERTTLHFARQIRRPDRNALI